MINRRHGGNITGKGIIDFSVNINPLGMPLALKEAVSKSLDKLSCYPEPESLSLKKALASIHNINEANLLIGNGSIEIIHLLPRALKIKKALIITPTFSEYEFAVRLSNAKPVFVKASEGNGFRIDTKLIRGLIPQANLVILCNPNNPTGVLAARETLMEILAPCIKYGKILLIDEVFLDFVDNAKEFSLLDQAVRSRHLLVLKSLTKFFAVPGLRIGYLIGHRSLILKLSKFQYPWNVNSLAQGIAKEIINCNGYRQKTKVLTLRERNFLSGNLKKFKTLKVYEPYANFIFCKLLKGRIKSARELNERLMQRGITMRACDNFRGLNGNFFRLAVRTRKENIKLLLALREILK